MQVSRDDELGSPPPPPPIPTGYYMPAYTSYGPMYFADPSAYGYPISPATPLIQPINLQTPDRSDVMSIIPTLRCWSCNKCGNLNYAHRLTCNLRKCQKMSTELGNGLAEADWMCACGNVNYRFRKYCNLRRCQLPQIGNPYLFYGVNQLIKSGYSSQAALSLLLTNGATTHETGGVDWAPQKNGMSDQQQLSEDDPSEDNREGCWQCVGCGNLNWPWRDKCNRKGCMQMKKSTCSKIY
jgi:hypothetical protein